MFRLFSQVITMRSSARESRGLRYLTRAAAPLKPFSSASTRYYILGDGIHMPMAKALRKIAVKPWWPVTTIDPNYRPQYVYTKSRGRLREWPRRTYYRYMRKLPATTREAIKSRPPNWPPRDTRWLSFSGTKAERHKLTRRDLDGVENIVVLAHCAHTAVGAFVARIGKLMSSGTKIFAACAPCHSPGLKGKMLILDGWEIQCPRGTNGYKKSLPKKEARKAYLKSLCMRAAAKGTKKRATKSKN